jgi:hypothetical protein
MDGKTSIETGKPMLLDLGTKEKNSGLVMQPCMFVFKVPISALHVEVSFIKVWSRESQQSGLMN